MDVFSNGPTPANYPKSAIPKNKEGKHRNRNNKTETRLKGRKKGKRGRNGRGKKDRKGNKKTSTGKNGHAIQRGINNT